jgi:hypothetical protein
VNIRICRILGNGIHHLFSFLYDDGGYSTAPSHAIQIGTPPENVFAMLEGVLGKERFEENLSFSRI